MAYEKHTAAALVNAEQLPLHTRCGRPIYRGVRFRQRPQRHFLSVLVSSLYSLRVIEPAPLTHWRPLLRRAVWQSPISTPSGPDRTRHRRRTD
jgi:hypothetical protein